MAVTQMPSNQGGGFFINLVKVLLLLASEVGFGVLHYVSFEKTLIAGRPGIPLVDLWGGAGAEYIGNFTLQMLMCVIFALAILLVANVVWLFIFKTDAINRFNGDLHTHNALAVVAGAALLTVIFTEAYSFSGLLRNFNSSGFLSRGNAPTLEGFPFFVLTAVMVIFAQFVAVLIAYFTHQLTSRKG